MKKKPTSTFALVLAPLVVGISSGCVAIGERALSTSTAVVQVRAGVVEKRVQVAGHNILYLEGGTGDPVLLLHGFSSKKEHFALMAGALTPHHRLFIPDIPGFGGTTYDPSRSYAPSEQVERLVAFVDEIGLDRFAVVGNSMGGHLAALLAIRLPERVTQLALLSPAGAVTPERSDFQKLLDTGVNPFQMKTDADAAQLLDLQFTTPPGGMNFVLDAVFASMKSRGARNGALFRDYLSERKFGIEDRLHQVVAPTLILWGEDDRMLHPSGGPIFASKISNATLIPLRACGHMPQLERPAETAAHLLRFLAVAAPAAPVDSSAK